MRPDLIHFHSASAAGKAIGLRAQLGCSIAVSLRADGADLGEPDAESLWREGDLFLFTDPAVLTRAVARGCPRERSEILPPLVTKAPPGGDPPSEAPLRILSSGPLVWERGSSTRCTPSGSRSTAVLTATTGSSMAGPISRRGVRPPPARPRRPGRNRHGGQRELSGGGAERTDVFVDAAVADTSPTPLLAAQALGVPYVATERDGLAEGAGMIVPRRDPRAIADALVTFARDPELRMGMAAVGRAQSDYSSALEADLGRLQNLYGAP